MKTVFANANQPLQKRLHRLRSAEIPCLLIHRDLSTSVVCVTGISSCLRPLLLWREQALLMLLTELIRPSFYLSISPSLSPVLPVLLLAPRLWHIQYKGAHSRGVMFSWLNVIDSDSVNEALKTVTHSLGLRSSNRSLSNSFETQWLDSKCLW